MDFWKRWHCLPHTGQIPALERVFGDQILPANGLDNSHCFNKLIVVLSNLRQGWISLWLCAHFYDCAHILMIVCTSSLGAPPLHHCHRPLPHSPHHCQPATIEDGSSLSPSLQQLISESEHNQNTPNNNPSSIVRIRHRGTRTSLNLNSGDIERDLIKISKVPHWSPPPLHALLPPHVAFSLRVWEESKCFVSHQVLFDDYSSLVVTWCASRAPRASGHQVGQAHCFSGSPCLEGSWKILVEEDRSAEQIKAFLNQPIYIRKRLAIKVF